MISNKNNPYKTVLTITVGFCILYLFTTQKWFLHISLFVGILGIFIPKIAVFIDLLWMKLAKILSLIIPNIILSLIYFLLLTPLAFLYRKFGNINALQLKNKQDTLWQNVEEEFEVEDFKKVW